MGEHLTNHGFWQKLKVCLVCMAKINNLKEWKEWELSKGKIQASWVTHQVILSGEAFLALPFRTDISHWAWCPFPNITSFSVSKHVKSHQLGCYKSPIVPYVVLTNGIILYYKPVSWPKSSQTSLTPLGSSYLLPFKCYVSRWPLPKDHQFWMFFITCPTCL